MTANDERTHTSDGLWRWLLGGLVGGAAILGLLIAAYAIGYHRGQDHPRLVSSAGSRGSNDNNNDGANGADARTCPVTAALVARGKTLYSTDGCSACHSLSGASGSARASKASPAARSRYQRQTVTANDAYLEGRSQTPTPRSSRATAPGSCPPLSRATTCGKPDDVRALVAFIKSQK